MNRGRSRAHEGAVRWLAWCSLALTGCASVGVFQSADTLLVPGGRSVPCSGGGGDWLGPIARILGGLLTFLPEGKACKMFMQKLDAADLVVMRELVEKGAVKPVVERTWALAETGAALQHVGSGHSRGLNVIRVAG
jgi:hypothetical protein